MDITQEIRNILVRHNVDSTFMGEIIDDLTDLLDRAKFNTVELTFDEAEERGLNGTLRTTDDQPKKVWTIA